MSKNISRDHLSGIEDKQAANIFRNVIKCAICLFEAYKCPGEDQILPVLLKIFRATFRWGYIIYLPYRGKHISVTYIPTYQRLELENVHSLSFFVVLVVIGMTTANGMSQGNIWWAKFDSN